MRNLFLILAIVATTALAANKNIRSSIVSNLNDRPVLQAAPDSSGGQSDTLYFNGSNQQNSRDSVVITSMFNSLRVPLQWDGMTATSSVIAKNPDSIVCNFKAIRVDADVSTLVYGIRYRLTNTLWYSYSATDTSLTTLTNYRVAAPWVAGKGYRPFFVTTTATDTTRVRFVECSDKVNP